MEIYLVGGAIRDRLLGLEVAERDWVVVGATPRHMLSLGFRPIGKHFPVFLHPKTHEEYALARTERKIGVGYHGFVFYTGLTVSLEDDLKRRDLTINAMASDKNDQLIDPYGGKTDLNNKILRHVSDAFVEDPLRVLRIARFASHLPDFTIAPQTMRLLQTMVKQGELKTLVAERVFKELSKALATNCPSRFFMTLVSCGAIIDVLGALQDKLDQRFYEILNRACKRSDEVILRFAVISSFLTLDELRQLAKRLRLPKDYYQLSLIVIRYRLDCQTIAKLTVDQCWQLLKRTDALRKPKRFLQFVKVSWMLDGDEDDFSNYRSHIILAKALKLCQQIGIKQIKDFKTLSGKAIGLQLQKKRLEALAKLWHAE